MKWDILACVIIFGMLALPLTQPDDTPPVQTSVLAVKSFVISTLK